MALSETVNRGSTHCTEQIKQGQWLWVWWIISICTIPSEMNVKVAQKKSDKSNNIPLTEIILLTGDFHFLWECARVILQAFWGKPNQTGSLCNLQDYINHKLVDKKGKTFSIADEFISHTFKAHLLAAVCAEFGVTSAHDNIPHDTSLEWF